MKTGRDTSRVKALHEAVDRAVAPLVERHAGRLRCGRGCAACCVDGLTVPSIEADRIREEHGVLLITGTPHAPGACAFLGPDRECRIYDARPYQCRVAGLPLRWHGPLPEGDGVGEYRDWCSLNETPEHPLEALADEECWTLGPIEEVLDRVQRDAGGPPEPVALRDLFRTLPGPSGAADG
jgi:Fe-S-cluster containining protein